MRTVMLRGTGSGRGLPTLLFCLFCFSGLKMLVLYFYLFSFWRIAHFESTSNPVAPSSSPVTLGSLPKFWCLYFLIHKMEIIKVTYFTGLMCIVNELIYVKYLEQRLVKDDIFYRWGHLDLITWSPSHSCWVVQIMKTGRLISELVRPAHSSTMLFWIPCSWVPSVSLAMGVSIDSAQ